MWDELRDRYESDSFFRTQVQVAVIVGAIGLGYSLMEIAARRKWMPDNGLT